MSTNVLFAPAVTAASRPRARFDATRLARLVWADVLERTRRPGYLVSLLVMVWLAQHMLPENGAGYRTFVMDDVYRPAYGAAWVGTLTALLTGMWFLFVGFYLVKGSVERDRRTGVGQVLAATRMHTLAYLWARVLGNLTVFASQAAVVAAVALVQQQLLGEDRRVDVAATLTPFVTLTLPLALLTAASAVFFDCVRWLRGGLGNIAWFFLLGFALAGGGMDDMRVPAWRDMSGARIFVGDVRAAMIAQHPDAASRPPSLSMGVNMSPRYRGQKAVTFAWSGLRWNAAEAGTRLPWLVLAALMVFASAIPFDRFDAAPRALGGARTRSWWPDRRTRSVAAAVGASAGTLTLAKRKFGITGVVRAELALLLRGQSPWWYVGLLGFLIAELAAPLTGVRQVVLPLASFWPALVWSQLGHRELRHDTGAVLFSCPRPVSRLLPGAWAAGAVVMLLAGAPALLRLGIAGEWLAVAGWLTCAAFVPSLALALGVWTGSAKFFEVLYLFAWYVGPMHHLPEVDYTGVNAARTPLLWAVYGALTALLFVVAWWGRRRQARR